MALVHAQAEFSSWIPSGLDYLLSQWGIWCRINKPGPKDYQSCAGKIQEMLIQQNADDNTFLVGDDVAQAWDAAISKLPRIQKALLVCYFVDRRTARFMAAATKTTKEEILEQIKMAALEADSNMESA